MVRYILIATIIALHCSDCLAVTGDATLYDLGLTACGTHHSKSEYVAATSFSYWTTANLNDDPMCQKTVRVINPANDRSVTVQIVDKCDVCKKEDIDLSRAAFTALGINPNVGQARINWNFN